ncbi:MAG: hypothetical protein AAF826_12375 [Pseudomonadota bacterium]
MAEVREKVTEWLANAVKDVSTLQVETYKCDITAKVTTSGIVSLSDFIDNLELEVDGSSDTCKVIMVTHGKIDHDTMVLYSNNLSADDQRFVTHHRETYEAAAKARSEVVDLAMRLARGAIVPE